MKKTPKFELTFDAKKANVTGLIEYQGDTREAGTVHNIHTSAYAFNTELQLLAQGAPERPDWFTLEDEQPVLFPYPFYNTFELKECLAFIRDMPEATEENENELYSFGCQLSYGGNNNEKMLAKASELEKKLFNKIHSFKKAFDSDNEKYKKDLNVFFAKRETTWKYYHAFLMMKVRFSMFGV